MRKSFFIPQSIVFFFVFFAAFSLLAGGAKPKYVFLFIGDGMSTPQRSIAEAYSVKMGLGKLAINHMPYKAPTTTHSANALVTDSAAAGTAIACGEKTNNGRIGMNAAGKRKLESVAFVAKKNGKKVGIVSSVTINHATPASFYAHRPSRSQYYEIGLDLIASSFDYFGGGGFSSSNNKKSPLYKGNLYDLAKEAGYTVARNKKEIQVLAAKNGKVLACGSSGALPYAINVKKDTITLADFTALGIKLLDNPNGFFLMVEGGAIDWHGHSNDAASNVKETLAFNKAVLAAMEFARKHPEETLIVVTGDHETGGMTMGFANSGYTFDPALLRHQKMSMASIGYGIARRVKKDKDFNFEKCKAYLRKQLAFRFPGDKATKENKDHILLTAAEEKMLADEFAAQYGKKKSTGKKRKPNFAGKVRILFNRKAGISWTTSSHTALPVLTTSQGCGAELFTGKLDNTQIAQKLKLLLQK